MQKAHLYEALYLVNHGIDEAVRGVQRLKKAPHAFREVYYKSVAGLERRRALINGQFMARDERRGRGQRLFLRRGIQSLALRRSPRQRGDLQARALPRGSTKENARTASRPVLEAEKTGERKRKRSPQASPEGHHPKTQKPPAQTKAQEQSVSGSCCLGRPDRVGGAKPRNAGDSGNRHPKAANAGHRRQRR